MMFRLTKRLQAYVQRKDESVLRALLPPKEELCIFVRCSEPQLLLYRSLMSHHEDICEAARGAGGEACKCKHLLAFHAATQKIVNHPDAIHINWKQASVRPPASIRAGVAGIADGLLSPPSVSSQTPATTLAQAFQCCGETGRTIELCDVPMTPQVLCLDEESKEGSAIVLINDDSRDGANGSRECDEGMDAACEMEEDTSKEILEGRAEDGVEGVLNDDEDVAFGLEDDEKEIVKTLGISWADSLFVANGEYKKGLLKLSGKMTVLMEIVQAAKSKGHKTLVFSQYRSTLTGMCVCVCVCACVTSLVMEDYPRLP
jgi:SNF2 family DNA or RNA helicase